jgi:hypothetical protein
MDLGHVKYGGGGCGRKMGGLQCCGGRRLTLW